MSVCLSVYLSIYLSIYLSFYLSMYVCMYLLHGLSSDLQLWAREYRDSTGAGGRRENWGEVPPASDLLESTHIHIYIFYLPIHPSNYLSIHLYVHISMHLSVCLSVCLSIYLSIYLSMYVSVPRLKRLATPCERASGRYRNRRLSCKPRWGAARVWPTRFHTHIFTYLSIHPSMYVSMYVSVNLSIHQVNPRYRRRRLSFKRRCLMLASYSIHTHVCLHIYFSSIHRSNYLCLHSSI